MVNALWYLAGLVTLPALFVLWIAAGLALGYTKAIVTESVDGRVVSERVRRGPRWSGS